MVTHGEGSNRFRFTIITIKNNLGTTQHYPTFSALSNGFFQVFCRTLVAVNKKNPANFLKQSLHPSYDVLHFLMPDEIECDICGEIFFKDFHLYLTEVKNHEEKILCCHGECREEALSRLEDEEGAKSPYAKL